MECLESIYGCVLVHGCVVAATEGWWSLDPMERKLLTIAISTESICTARDVPVFLPCKSPNVNVLKEILDLISQNKNTHYKNLRSNIDINFI